MSQTETGRVLATEQVLTAQQGVIGSMLQDPDTVPEVLSQTRAEDFSHPELQEIYLAIAALYQAGKPIDAMTINGQLGGTWGKLLVQLMEVTPTAANVGAYIDQLRQTAQLLRLQDLGTELTAAGTLEAAQELLTRAQSFRISRQRVQQMDMADGFGRFLDRHNGENKPKYLSWGMDWLNRVLLVEPGDMVILGGYPSDGKTALALQFASAIAKGKRVGYYSFESTRDKLYDRYVARTAMISYTRIRQNELTEKDYRELAALRSTLTAPQLTLIDAARMTVADIQAHSDLHGFEVIFVDYLQKVAAPKGARMSEFERVTAVSSEFQQFGREHGTTIVALSQLSRPDQLSQKSKQKLPAWRRGPQLSDLRSSGQLEQDADVILFVFREDYDLKDSDRFVRIAKNKDGEAGDWKKLKFDGDLQTFSATSYTPEPYHPRRKDQIEIHEIVGDNDPENPFLRG